jgi:hypothetical protein
MKNLSSAAQVYIIGVMLAGLGLIVWRVEGLEWTNPGLCLVAVLGAAARILKVEITFRGKAISHAA